MILLGFSTEWDTYIIWVFSSFRVCFRTLLRMLRCAMTYWIVTSASVLHRWVLPIRGSKIQLAFLVCIADRWRVPLMYWLWKPELQAVLSDWARILWHCCADCKSSVCVPFHAQAQAELNSTCISRLNNCGQNETMLESKQCHLE